jgi:predicted metalloprotease
MATRTRITALVAVAVVAGLLLPACSATVTGTPVASPTAASEATFPPGLSIITESTPAETPTSAEEAVQNVTAFWNGGLEKRGIHPTVQAAHAPLTCGTTTYSTTPAVRCAGGSILYDADWAQGLLADAPNGPVALELSLAHEVGHSIQSDYGWFAQLEAAPRVGAVAAAEISADCLAGVYMSSTHVSPAELDGALALTPIGETPVRSEAFRHGLHVTDSDQCITNYLN